ncbi:MULTISPECIES: poly-beta-1,6-N-acetyl-D-glucosamine biosynthesis protein PgaD [Acinetobacter]|uniref:poly-beta-1,6-N-acetyl-D-glucosamine biosynthesis protein PgaD n=1 Tax=Acinetobacter TaxID=469 RepID=UPI0025763F19|nr:MULTISPECIES: poly-beta-1,6-N-acetyl-D-glucosamine biosynthesis protein PgaD [Acinetobacter]MDM1246409.1 poly-beta-1,6-N-acetyl-D-glucosamine biosynthesis protein PgaD [Acinetobacter sp. R933-2]MDM1762878.1 poly-beta-1,6-N-acetyl-D-glucosamine biosynthesis protein PgaD [Acinetobacter sp. 226-1]MDM1766357.1 poly-beta-1,6-N-acetyl-D-glucosamine biosynthesis protein PgaD [Acinetobacter sp. 226-4]MDQ9020721.1 poly-beta-1,6-N-acetyl-D-glucosamine biosynthesis protein PgaD [Acinetobacter sichuanen
MKASNLIIDLRQQLPWHKRYISTTSTAMLWGVWILLWRPLLLLIGVIGIQKPHIVHNIMQAFTVILQHGLIALMVCALSLLLWNRFIPAKTPEQAKTKSLSDYAEHFALNEQEIDEGRHQKISIVHHDEHGKIISIQ